MTDSNDGMLFNDGLTVTRTTAPIKSSYHPAPLLQKPIKKGRLITFLSLQTVIETLIKPSLKRILLSRVPDIHRAVNRLDSVASFYVNSFSI